MHEDSDEKKPGLDLGRLAIELKAVGEGVRAALSEHKKRRQSVVIWRDGEIVELSPDELPEETSESGGEETPPPL